MKNSIQKGQRFGRLVAVSEYDKNKRGLTTWVFQCDCGCVVTTPLKYIFQGYVKSCGCLKTDVNIKKNKERRRGGQAKPFKNLKEAYNHCDFIKKADFGYTLVFGNLEMNMQEWADTLGISREVLNYRILNRWPLHEALTPIRLKHLHDNHKG